MASHRRSSLSEVNRACFTCRLTSRQGQRCPRCRRPLEIMGTRWRAPGPEDHRGWQRAYDRHCAELRDRMAAETRSRMDDLRRPEVTELARLRHRRRLSPAETARLQVLSEREEAREAARARSR